MHMNPSDFEEHLRAFRPAAPSAKVARVVEVELTQISPSCSASGVLSAPPENPLRRFLGGLCWAVGGAAAAIIIAGSVGDARHSSRDARTAAAPAGEPSYFEQTGTERELLWAEASDVVYDDEEQPSQVVSYSSVERYTWTNPTTGALVEVEVPRQDVVLMPVSFQ